MRLLQGLVFLQGTIEVENCTGCAYYELGMVTYETSKCNQPLCEFANASSIVISLFAWF